MEQTDSIFQCMQDALWDAIAQSFKETREDIAEVEKNKAAAKQIE